MPRRWMAATMVAGLVACQPSPAGADRAVAEPSVEPYFEYRVGMWINLHHFLYVLGRAQEGVPDARRSAVAGAPLDTEGFDLLSSDDQAAWRDAVAFYQATLSQRDTVFNRDLIRTTLALARAGDAPSVAGRVDDELATVLDRVGPIYREVWWPRHRAVIDARIAEWNELLERYGAALTARLSQLYRLTWPGEGVPIEVTAYANWAGAYSTSVDGEGVIVMSALYEGNEGLGGVESSLHESLHQGNDVGARARELSREHGLDLHGWLTHGLIFYTTGEIVREQVPSHVPNGVAFGVWDRVAPELPPAFDEHWRPYMAGEVSLDEALLALLEALQHP